MHDKCQAPKTPTLTLPRTIRTHECTEADKLLQIHAGPDGPGGAPHYYEICYLVFNAHGVSAGSRCKTIQFQQGPICENGLNGITNEALLAIVADRLDRFQKGPFACIENERARLSVGSAIYHLHERTRRRQAEHAEGTSYERGHPTNDDTTTPDPGGVVSAQPSPRSEQEPEAQAPGTSSSERTVGIDFAKGNSEHFAAVLTLDGEGKVISVEKLDIETGRRMIREIIENGLADQPSEPTDAPAEGSTA